MNFMSIKPRAPVQKNDYQEVPLEIEINGYFFSLLDFVYRVEKLPRIINITAIDVQEGEAKLPNIKVVVQVKTFIMTPGLKETTTGTSGAAMKGGGTTGTTQQQTTGGTSAQ
ncbi:MAG: type 4a pilus biogenesis protein PilO [Actinomycetota bacterium]